MSLPQQAKPDGKPPEMLLYFRKALAVRSAVRESEPSMSYIPRLAPTLRGFAGATPGKALRESSKFVFGKVQLHRIAQLISKVQRSTLQRFLRLDVVT